MKLVASSSPHIRDKTTTSRLMLDVIIALLPALAVGGWQFGLRALVIVLISVFSALLGEWLYRIVTKQHSRSDCPGRKGNRRPWSEHPQ